MMYRPVLLWRLPKAHRERFVVNRHEHVERCIRFRHFRHSRIWSDLLASATMANKSDCVYGLDKELAEKRAAKYSPELEAQALDWVRALTGLEKSEDQTAQEFLKDGVALCKLMNRLQPDAVKKVNESKMAFKQMENINNFLVAAQAYGVPAHSLFQTVDLFDDKNMVQVIDAILALGGAAQKNRFDGPVCGVKHADKNVREFDEQTLIAGKTIMSQHTAGYTGGANQSGMLAPGTRREIDIYSRVKSPSEQ